MNRSKILETQMHNCNRKLDVIGDMLDEIKEEKSNSLNELNERLDKITKDVSNMSETLNEIKSLLEKLHLK